VYFILVCSTLSVTLPYPFTSHSLFLELISRIYRELKKTQPSSPINTPMKKLAREIKQGILKGRDTNGQ
jgi:hypothetical protein